jgi:hypothetical protein
MESDDAIDVRCEYGSTKLQHSCRLMTPGNMQNLVNTSNKQRLYLLTFRQIRLSLKNC